MCFHFDLDSRRGRRRDEASAVIAQARFIYLAPDEDQSTVHDRTIIGFECRPAAAELKTSGGRWSRGDNALGAENARREFSVEPGLKHPGG
jgi:hypothetical protein